jgi:hypothetical protein
MLFCTDVRHAHLSERKAVTSCVIMNRILRRLIGCKRQDVTREWVKLRNGDNSSVTELIHVKQNKLAAWRYTFRPPGNVVRGISLLKYIMRSFTILYSSGLLPFKA